MKEIERSYVTKEHVLEDKFTCNEKCLRKCFRNCCFGVGN